jgi:hypothetical protein
LDESVSSIIDTLGEEVRELLSISSSSLRMYCYTGNSSFRIGS